MSNYIKFGLVGLGAFYALAAFAACPCPPGPSEKVGNFNFVPQSFTVITKPGSSAPIGEIVVLKPASGSQTTQVKIADVQQLQQDLQSRYAKRNVLVKTICQATGLGTVRCTVTYPLK